MEAYIITPRSTVGDENLDSLQPKAIDPVKAATDWVIPFCLSEYDRKVDSATSTAGWLAGLTVFLMVADQIGHVCVYPCPICAKIS